MTLGKKILVATALTGIFAMANLGAVQAEDYSAETAAFEQDEDLVTPRERALSRSPHRYPGWSWMTKSQALLLLKANGFSDVVNLEKAGPVWRGKATKDNASYHVAIDRYADIFAHLDKKSRTVHAAFGETQKAQASLSYCDLRRIC